MELDLLTTHGTVPSPTPNPFIQDIGNHAAIQIAPMSGEVGFTGHEASEV